MKAGLLVLSVVVLGSAIGRSETYFVDGSFVPHPDHPVLEVRMELFDVRDVSNAFTSLTEPVNGTTSLREYITPPEGAEQIKITFAADLPDFNIIPADVTLPVAPKIHVRRIAWLPAAKKREEVYLASFTQAKKSLEKSKRPSQAAKARVHAEYALAVAKTGNQKVEAAKLAAQANLAVNKADEAMQVLADTAAEPNFDKADEKKKKAFVGEWFDTVESVAKSEGAKPDNETGVVFTSVPVNSKVPEQLNDITKALSKVDPKFEAKAASRIPKESAVLGSRLAGTENVVRSELSRHPYTKSQ
jgi:ribosome assembly protein YihI (activator of Der GTPase)